MFKVKYSIPNVEDTQKRVPSHWVYFCYKSEHLER